MATFHYRATTTSGKWQQGTRQGKSKTTVAQDLQRLGLIPVYVGADPEQSVIDGWRGWLQRLTAPAKRGRRMSLFQRSGSVGQDRLRFTQELATLLQAGLPLDRSIRICSQLTASGSFRSVVAELLDQVKAGKSLSDALAEHPKIFSKLYVNMVRAGQASGTLPVVFQRLSDFEVGAAEWRSHLISTLIYPVLLIVVAVASMAVLLNFVIPRFAEVFESIGAPLPLSTSILLAAGQFFQTYWWLLALGVLAIFVIFDRVLRSVQGREKWDRFVFRFPLVGEMVRKAETARFARTMATLVSHSVPLVESLQIVKETITNSVMARSIESVIQGVKRGEGVSGPLEHAQCFPPLAVHLLRVGEETGRLDVMFDRLANIYDAETRVALRRLTALFEPIVILGMGLMVGAIVLSLLLAITSINDIPF